MRNLREELTEAMKRHLGAMTLGEIKQLHEKIREPDVKSELRKIVSATVPEPKPASQKSVPIAEAMPGAASH